MRLPALEISNALFQPHPFGVGIGAIVFRPKNGLLLDNAGHGNPFAFNLIVSILL